jgi:ribonucleoside-triphosphate reductase
LSTNHPELLEDEYFNPDTQSVVSIPQKAPSNSIIRNESVFDLLERVKRYSIRWVTRGHNTGMNSHNVSATISIKPDEWDAVGEWMWMNRHYYNGLSVLPYDGGTYVQAPFEDCKEAEYNKMLESLKEVDLTKVIEYQDNTDLTGELACAGGQCEI